MSEEETVTSIIANSRYNFLDSLSLDQDVISRLSIQLENTSRGSNQVLTTPLAKNVDPDVILSELDKIMESGKDKLITELIELEEMNRDKYGPRSIAIPWAERRDSLDASFKSIDIDTITIDSIKSNINGNLRPLTVKTAAKLLKNDTNSGLPFYTRKGNVKERVVLKFDSLLERKDPCILFTRTQEQKKTRNVWGYPIADTLNEMKYYSPLLGFQKQLKYRSALRGPDDVSRCITELILRAVRSNSVLISIDFSAYDTTVRSQLQKAAFNYIKSCYQSQFSSEIDYIAERFRSIGILTPDGVITGDHGVPSGSTFTNEVDSIVQLLVSYSSGLVDMDSIQIQGDDGVYLVKDGSETKLIDKFDSFKLEVNKSKTYTAKDFVVYLQCLFHLYYMKDGLIGGIYPLYRALNRLIYQERWSNFEDFGIQGKDYYSIRAISILENCKHHPLFEEFVKLVLKYDKYSLDFTDQGLANYVKFVSNSQGAGEILNHQYGSDVTGIKSFSTFKLIKRLS